MNRLLRYAGVVPYLAVVFLNAFVDLGHKITIQNTIFKVYDGNTQVILTAVVNGLILLPFILLFNQSGFISDRFPKSIVMQKAAWAAVFITTGITLCYYLGLFWPAFALTFLLAIQSAIYSPAKYGYIKSLFGKENLAEANALVQATTILAILLSTFVFSILFESWFPEGSTKSSGLIAIAPIGWILMINSLIELVVAYRLPKLDNGNSSEPITVQSFFKNQSLLTNIKPVTRNKVIRLSIIGLAVFWSVGQVMLAAFPAFAKENLDVTNTVIIQGILAATGIGIAIGAALAGRWSKGHIETGLIPLGAAGISIGLLILPGLTSVVSQCLNFLFIGVMGGLFIVPLNALIQFSAKEHQLGKVLAGNNLIQNLSMLGFLILTAAFSLVGINSQHLLSFIAIVAVLGCFYTIYQLPQSLVRVLLMAVMSRRYSIDVQGIKNIPAQGGVLMLGNHISWVDWAMVQIASPRPIRFVMLKSIYDRWYLTGFLKLAGCIPITSGASSKDSLKKVAQLLDDGEVVCLFPEGSISRNGHLGEFRKGYEIACGHTQTNISIIPFYLRGLWGSQFSRSSDKLKDSSSSGLYRDIIVAFGAPLPKTTTADILKRKVFDLSVSAWQQHVDTLPTLAQAWINTAKRRNNEMAIADSQSGSLSAIKLLIAGITFSKRIKKISPEQNIGLFLPTSNAAVIANMACLLIGKTVINLNYSSSNSAIKSAIEQAEINTIYTSKTFLKKLKQRDIDFSTEFENHNVIYMEDLRDSITKFSLITQWLTVKIFPTSILKLLYCRANDAQKTAAIVFTSGSEGAPKGVMLSHQNIMANLKQISDVLNTQHEDVVMASLPLFHAFGLTVTQFMPLVEGLPIICQPDPTDVLSTAKLVAQHRATIMFGTSTFLRLYTKNRKVHPLMLDSLRIVVAGAEKLNPQVQKDFLIKFGKHVLEGYGATETTPVASVNLPDALDLNFWQVQIGGKPGTVGMPLPGSSFKIIDPDTELELGTEQEGMIIIGGIQVMQGYLNKPFQTNQVIRIIDDQRWYITGDKGRIDKDGFLSIIDRYSRFAKIGGEMISLSFVEEQVRLALIEEKTTLDDNFELLATNIEDDKKGETIVVLSTATFEMPAIKKTMLANGNNPLAIPAQQLLVEEIPKLGSGKTDFSKAKAIAIEMIKANNNV